MISFRRLPKNNATGCTGNPWSNWVTDDIAASSGVCYNNQAYYLFNVAGGPCYDSKKRETGPGILPCYNKVLGELLGIGTMDGTAWGGITRDDLAIRYGFSPPPLLLHFPITSRVSMSHSFYMDLRKPGRPHMSSSHPLHYHTQTKHTSHHIQTLSNTRNSALQAYKLNNNTNGYQMPPLTNIIDDQGQTGDIYFENGIQTPGLTTIPICDIETVSSNWVNHGKSSSKPAGYPCS